ncbi:MAG TPA: serine/threonine-protein kinase [Polyangiaceae bacterium]
MSEGSRAAEGRTPVDGTETDLESSAGSPRRDGSGSTDGLPLRSRERYERLGEHARGGIGKITRARDRELGRALAIKEMQSPERGAVDRFVREARITMRLEHPSIVPVHDAGRWESGEPFYAMKLVAGRTLKEVVQDKHTLAERLTLLPNIIAVADAMAYAHEQRVIHRDLKASNVLLGAFGETIVIDWGLAKDLSLGDDPSAKEASPYRRQGGETEIGAVVGTPSFMPPEQARGEDVDERADIYALGALLYFVLSGKPPHEGASSTQVLARVREQPHEPIAEVAPGIPSDLAAIVERAMARDKEARYPSAKQLAEDLKRFQAGQMVAAHRYSTTERVARWVRRHRAIAAVTVAFAGVAAAGLLAFGVRESRLRHEAEAERDRADQKTLALLEQQGRAELESGHPFRAAVFLSDAFHRAPDRSTLRSLLTQAVRPMARLEWQLRGHTRDVPFVAYSPDGTRIVTASTDKTVRIWSADTGALVRVLQHPDAVDAADFSPDGKLVVSGALDNLVRIWSVETGEVLRSFKSDAYRVAFTPDGARIVCGSQLGGIQVFDASTGELVSQSKLHTDRLQQFAFSPDGRTMAVAGWDRTVSLWDLPAFTLSRTIKDHEKEVGSVAFSHDGKRLVTAESDVYLHVRDAATGANLHTIRMPEQARWPVVSFSPDDQVIYTTSHDGIVRAWHATTGTLLATIDAQPTGKLMHSALRPGGRDLVTSGAGGVVSVWNVGDAPGFRILPWPTGRAEMVYPSVYSPDGKRILAGGTAGTVAVWDAASGRLESSFQVPGEAFSLAPNRDGSRVVVSGTLKPCFPPGLWDTASGKRLADITGHTAKVYNVATSPDGATVATSSYDGSVRLCDAQTGEPRGFFQLGKERIPAVTFAPDGRELAAVTENGKLLLFDRGSGTVRQTIDAHKTWIQDVVYSADGARVLTVGRQDHTARVWNVASGRLELELGGRKDNLLQGSFSPDGRFIAAAGVDHVATIWDARTGDLLRTIPGADFSATFSPDGRELLTTGYDGYAVVWDATLDQRSAEQLADFVRERSPWELVEGRLQLRAEPGEQPTAQR